MELKIISQTETLYEGAADLVSVPGVKGQMGILPGHANLVSILDVGPVKIENEGAKKFIAMNGGVVVVRDDKIVVLANEAMLADDVLAREIDEALEMAEEKRSSKLEASELIQLERQIRYEKLKKKVRDRLG